MKSLHSLKGGGTKSFTLSWGGDAKTFGHAIFPFCSPPPLPVIKDQSLISSKHPFCGLHNVLQWLRSIRFIHVETRRFQWLLLLPFPRHFQIFRNGDQWDPNVTPVISEGNYLYENYLEFMLFCRVYKYPYKRLFEGTAVTAIPLIVGLHMAQAPSQ